MALAVDESFGVPIVSVEEQMRGWLATIAKERQIERQIKPYFELVRLFEFYQAFAVHSLEFGRRKNSPTYAPPRFASALRI